MTSHLCVCPACAERRNGCKGPHSCTKAAPTLCKRTHTQHSTSGNAGRVHFQAHQTRRNHTCSRIVCCRPLSCSWRRARHGVPEQQERAAVWPGKVCCRVVLCCVQECAQPLVARTRPCACARHARAYAHCAHAQRMQRVQCAPCVAAACRKYVETWGAAGKDMQAAKQVTGWCGVWCVELVWRGSHGIELRTVCSPCARTLAAADAR
jgi:hypothetical protein